MGFAEHRNAVLHTSAWSKLTQTLRQIWTYPPNRGQRVRRLAGFFGWQVWERTLRRPWTIRFDGDLRLVLHPHDFITSGVLYRRVPEYELMYFQRAWLKRTGGTFVDAGANVGLYSLWASRVEGVRCVAFEPSSVTHSWAVTNVELNGLEDRIVVEPLGLGERSDTLRLTTGLGGMNHITDDAEAKASEEIEIARLDDYVATHDVGRVSLMKVDVEGHELPVLRGAHELLQRDRPALIVEVNEMEGLVGFADSLGYLPLAFDPETGRAEKGVWPESLPANVILVPAVDEAIALLERS